MVRIALISYLVFIKLCESDEYHCIRSVLLNAILLLN